MANGVLVLGPAGTGKSTGIRNLDPAKTFIICSDRKPLPIRGWKTKYKTVLKEDGKSVDMMQSNYLETNHPATIQSVMQYVSDKRSEVTSIVVDTLGHVMTSEFMKSAKVIGFQKFTDLALDVYNICNKIPDLRKDLFVFILSHVEQGYNALDEKVIKIRTIGKLLDEKVNIESMFTVVLLTNVKENPKENQLNYTFITNNGNPAKSPMGMFDTKEIPNDYQFVIDKVLEYEHAE